MKNVMALKAAAVVLPVLFVSSVLSGGGGVLARPAAAGAQREEINKNFTLSPKADVDVSGISGSVDIKALDGDTVNVHIERHAPTRAELECNRAVVEQSGNRLTILSRTESGRACQNIRVFYRVVLGVPRNADLSVRGVSGPVSVEGVEGALRVSGNSGEIKLAQPGSGSQVSGNSGSITVDLRALGAGGLELSGNSGRINLRVSGETNADVRVSGLGGSIRSGLARVKVTKTGDADYYARIGAGGPTIRVEGNSGDISINARED